MPATTDHDQATRPRSGHILETIYRCTSPPLSLPVPVSYAMTERTITLGLATPAQVDAWQRHIGLTPASDQRLAGQYGTVDFLPEPGWCGATLVILWCRLPEVTR